MIAIGIIDLSGEQRSFEEYLELEYYPTTGNEIIAPKSMQKCTEEQLSKFYPVTETQNRWTSYAFSDG